MNYQKRRTSNLISIILLSTILTISFGLLTSQILGKIPLGFDESLIDTIQSVTTPTVITAMKAITFLGSTTFLPLLLLILVYLLYKRWGLRRQSFILALNLGGAFVITEIIKSLIKRPRPILVQYTHASGFSFPSSHAMVSFAFYGLLSYLIVKNIKTPILRWGLASLLIFIAILVGGSRLFLGVHYPSDVLGGSLLGALWLAICIAILEYLESRQIANE